MGITLSLSLFRSPLPKTIITCTLVFLLCLGVGIFSGAILRNNQKPAEAASANITVVDNNQIVTEDQGTPTIVRTSTVTIKDTTATLGYTLLAKISTTNGTTPIPGATVTIYPTIAPTAPSTSPCTQTTPCTLPYDNGTGTLSPLEILTVPEPTATQQAGHTTQWTVTISLPQNTPQGNYITDIAYTEDPILPPTTTYGAMQTMANAQCSTTRGTAYDARNNQVYYVQKIGNLCWMETNLRYAGDGNYDSNWGYTDDRYATTTALATNTANPNDNTRPLTVALASNYTDAQYASPGGSADYTNTTPNGGFYGYLYNWCSAMGGQPNACNDTSSSGFDTTTSICPAGWRLPTGGNSGEYQALNTVINSGSISNDAGLRTNFLAVYSGYYSSGLVSQGSNGRYWSSSVNSAISAYLLNFGATLVRPGTGDLSKSLGFAVRCVLD